MPPPFRIFPKIHPFWKCAASLSVQKQSVAVCGMSGALLGGIIISMSDCSFDQSLKKNVGWSSRQHLIRSTSLSLFGASNPNAKQASNIPTNISTNTQTSVKYVNKYFNKFQYLNTLFESSCFHCHLCQLYDRTERNHFGSSKLQLS